MNDLRVGASYSRPTDLIVINPTAWSDIRLAKDANNNYYAGSPFQGGPNQLFGVDVAVTTRQPAGTALVTKT